MASSRTRSRRKLPGCAVQQSPRCAGRWAHKPVKGSYSTRLPRSSLARVHRVFVLHIVEEEAEDVVDEQDDGREE